MISREILLQVLRIIKRVVVILIALLSGTAIGSCSGFHPLGIMFHF